jgi:oligopeptide transport system substrate-binding protein
MNIMEGLVSFDSNLKVTPLLAKSWRISPDGTTYTFTLRSDVAWSDGVPLKAADFVYSWMRLLSPITAAESAYVLFDIEGAEAFHDGKQTDPSRVGIKALDEHTLQIKLIHPLAHWIYIPTFWVTFPLRQDIVEKYGEGWATPGRMVSLGPYRLLSHDLNQRYVLSANPNYYGKKGNVQKLVAIIEKDDVAAMKMYEAGKIDFLTDISTADLKRFSGRKDLHDFPYLTTAYLGFSTTNYPLNYKSFRRAIAMAIDRRALVKLLYQARPATSFIPPPMPDYAANIGLPYNPAQAKAEYRSALIDPYRKFEVNLILPNWEKEQTVAHFVQEQLQKNLGLAVKISSMENRGFRLLLDLHGSPLFLGHWSADFPDADNFMSIFVNESGDNRFGWRNEEFNRLVVGARETLDPEKRRSLYQKAQKILLESDAVVVPLYYQSKSALIQSRVHGLTLNPVNYLLLGSVTVDQ